MATKDFMGLAERNWHDMFNYSETEKGALGYSTTGKKLLDVSFKLASYRQMPDAAIIKDFFDAAAESPELALRFLFYARDIRGGAGERRYFRVIMAEMARRYPELASALAVLVGEYGRYDDILDMYGISRKVDDMLDMFVGFTLANDYQRAKDDESFSLMAKWLPSYSTNNPMKKAIAIHLIKELFENDWMAYSKFLSYLRGKLDIVERKMSAGEWDKIDYSKVPSIANMLYNKAFFKHDPERRLAFIESLKKGEAKINSSVAFPHDIIRGLSGNSSYKRSVKAQSPETDILEQMWAALPRYADMGSTLVVQDGSGSMTTAISGSTEALHVSAALAIYFSETCSGPYRDKFITFSRKPQFIHLDGCTSLRHKLETVYTNVEIDSTDIEAVFRLVLVTAVQNQLSQEELPARILIISDMEFDTATSHTRKRRLFDGIQAEYAIYGYKVPQLVFWNVASRSGTIPMRENENGVTLVSGFSPNAIKMVLTGKTDPYEALVDTLMDERYDPVSTAMKNYNDYITAVK